jgi:hypothetical protein
MLATPRARLFLLLALWGAVALVGGAFGLLRRLPPPGPQLLVAGMTVALSLALARVAWIAEAARALPTRAVVAFHLTRFVGFAFLWLHAQGRLPAAFAHRAGWGDVLAATGAAVLLLWPDGPGSRRALAAWNVFGALDLLLAVSTAGAFAASQPGSMVEITRLPLALIPLWGVPVLLSSHIYLLRTRVRAARPGAQSERRALTQS